MLRFFREKFYPFDKINQNEEKKTKYTSEKQNISMSYGTFCEK
jgi:hypothetical protein